MSKTLEMPKSETQDGADKMAYVERQVLGRHARGCTITILCPWCSKLNLQGQLLCCDDLRKAVIAVLMGDRAMKIAEAAGQDGN